MANKLVLEILADSNGLIKGLNQAQSSLDKFMKSADAAGQSVGGGINRALDAFTNLAGGGANAAGALAGAFAAATTAAFAMTVQAGKIAEETDHLAQKTGIAAVSLEGMSVAMARTGLGSQSIATAVKGLSKEMVGAANGAANSMKLFADMGISMDTVGRGTGATLRAIADAFQKMPDGAQKAALAVELFGKSGLDLIPILNKGAAGLDEAMKKSAEFGLILSDTARTDLTTFDDAMDDLGSAIKGFGMQVGIAFAPSLTILVKAFTDVIVFTKNVFNQFADAAEKLTIRFGAMVASIQIVSSTLFSLQAFSKAAWEETLNHVKAIDAWAAAEIQGVESARAAQKELDALAMKHMDSAKSVEAHAASQQKLGEQIVATTKIQLAQIDAMGKQQERMGHDIVSGAKVSLQVEADAGKEQEALGRTIHRNFAASEAVAQQWVDSYMEVENASMARFQAEMDALDRNEEAQGRFIVQQAIDAQKLGSFWTRSLDQIEQAGVFAFGALRTSFGNAVAGMILGTTTFTQFVQSMYQTILSGAVQLGINLVVEWGRTLLQQLVLSQATNAAKVAGTVATNTAIVASNAAAGAATVGIWAGASTAVLGFFSAIWAGIAALYTSLMVGIASVGTAIMGVLSAIAAALYKTLFGSPLAAAITIGVIGIGIALAVLAATKFAEGGIVTGPTLGMVGEAGPEAIIPLDQLGSFGSGGQTTIVIQLDGREIARNTLSKMPGLIYMKTGLA